MQRRAKNREDKLQALKNIIRGNVQAALEAREYIAIIDDNTYNITCLTTNTAIPFETREQYEAFKASLSPKDKITVIDFCRYTDEEVGPKIEALKEQQRKWDEEQLAKQAERQQQLTEQPQPQQTKKGKRAKKQQIEQAQQAQTNTNEILTMPEVQKELPRAGKLSEYGETWGLSEESRTLIKQSDDYFRWYVSRIY